MPLAAGVQLGPYEIVSALGAGGMGEVYAARDTRLDRRVAVKTLPHALVANEARRSRLDREARAIASLTHPHICALYDVGHHDGIDFIVMELVDGETLATRLERGPMPLGELLTCARQIAGALAHAHASGIIHRDLKPANVMLTRAGVKLLDFGVAKISRPVTDTPLATLTAPQALTAEGSIVGTLHYMAPEQLEGNDVDTRADLFAFGAVLYEMATGRQAFEGTSTASVIAAVLERDPPPVITVAPVTPPLLDRLIRMCLAKRVVDRWQSARDLAEALAWIEAGLVASPTPSAMASRPRWRAFAIPAALVAVAAVIAAGLTARVLRRPQASGPTPVRFLVPPPLGATAGTGFAVAPDGRRLVLSARDTAGPSRLWIRAFDTLQSRPLPGTEGAVLPFWSPDSRSIAFFAGGKLKKIDTADGTVVVLCDARSGEGGTWNAEGTIVFAPDVRGPLWRVPDTGGIPAVITTLDPSRGESTHRSPQFLPGGRRFLFLARATETAVYVGSLDGGAPAHVLTSPLRVAYAAGHLFFVRDGRLLAQRFDVDRLALMGTATPLSDDIATDVAFGTAAFSVSETGVLVTHGGSVTITELTWLGRRGERLGTLGPPDDYLWPRLSPDGRRVVVERHDAGGGDLWMLEVDRGTRAPLTTDGSHNSLPVWSPDGDRIVFRSYRAGAENLFWRPVDGEQPEALLLSTPANKMPSDWSSDGRFILYAEQDAKGGFDLWRMPAAGDRTPTPILRTVFSEWNPRLSPDGTWMAYTSNESGHTEVYLRRFSGDQQRWQVSNGDGSAPRWRSDGRELFYMTEKRTIMAVPFTPGNPPSIGAPQTLFESQARTPNDYEVTANGQRFLVNRTLQSVLPPLTVLLNWSAGTSR